MKKYVRIPGLLSAFLFLIVSCNQSTDCERSKEEKEPMLVLRSLMILNEEVDIRESASPHAVGKERITSMDITAEFDYGNERGERIGVKLEGGSFNVDRTKPTPMKMRVPADKGFFQEWTGSVMISFKLQDMPIEVLINGDIKSDDTNTELPVEVAEFIVGAEEGVVEKVVINDGKKDYELILGEKLENPGVTVCLYSTRITLSTDAYTEYKMTVTPKDPTLYHETKTSYRVKGTRVSDSNANFFYENEFDPSVKCSLTWVEGCESKYPQDYGATSLTITAYTESPRASVFVKTVNPLDDSAMQGISEIKLTNDGKGEHTGDIPLLKDKPTRLIAYVKAEDNSTNDEKGKWMKDFNPIDLFWGYDDSKLATAELRKNASLAYSEIKIENNSVVNDKVFIAFVMWGESFGFRPGDEISKMTDYKKLDSFGDKNSDQQAYQFSVNVSDLMQSGDEKNVEIPVLQFSNADGVELTPAVNVFKYTFKIKVK